MNIKKSLKYLIIFFAGGFIFINSSHADENFSGTWYITVANVRYTMDITQRSHQLFGNMIQVNDNRRVPIIVYGKANGRRIKLNCQNKDLSLILLMKGVMTGSGSGRVIAGSVKKNNRNNFVFRGIRYY